MSRNAHNTVCAAHIPPGYKQTEVGVIPEEWEVSPVSEMGEVVAGKALAANGAGTQRPYLRTKNVFDGRISVDDVLNMPMTDDEFARFRLRHGDVLLNEGQSLELVGRCAVYQDEYPEACAIQNQLLRFRARSGVSASFAAHLFRNCQQSGVFTKIALQTTSIAHLGSSRFERLRLAWPRAEAEQRAIAEALGDVDFLIASLDRLITKKRDLKQAAMQQLLTGKTRLPGFKGEWEVRRLGDVFQVLRTANNPRSDLSPFGDTCYIHYGDIHTSTAAFLDCVDHVLPMIDKTKVVGLPLVQDGDLVMADASEDTDGLGKSMEVRNVTHRQVVAGLHTFLLRGNRACLADGFKGYIQFMPEVKAALVRLATGISVYGVSKNGVRSIEVRLPTTAEQSAIAAVLSDMNAEIAAVEARRDKSRGLKQGMMQELLTGRVRLV